jgi:hypothetical protein
MLQYVDTVIAFAVVMLGFSLLITLLNQMISAFLGYRGSNLRWGVETLLKTLDPNLAQHARSIADQVLSHQIVSDSVFSRFKGSIPVIGQLLQRWKLASAISPDTLVRTLRAVTPDLKTASATAGQALENLLKEEDPSVVRKLEQLQSTIGTKLSGVNYAIQFDDMLKQLSNSAQQSVGKVEAWFNITMGRVAQRFTTQIRIWTVGFAFLLAFGSHLDSFQLFNQLLDNPVLRQKLVNQSQAVLDQADGVLGAPGSTSTAQNNELSISPQVLNNEMKTLIEKEVDKVKEATPVLLGKVPTLNSISQAEAWLRSNLKPEVTDTRYQELATKYRGLVINALKDKLKTIGSLFQTAGIDLIQGDRKLSDLKNPFWFFFHFEGMRNFLGVLLTAGLLALGAPFWYNALKTLANLRPVVATRQEEQREEKK